MCYRRILLFSLPSNRLHRTDDGGVTNHRNASATVNKRAESHSPGISKPREDTSKTIIVREEQGRRHHFLSHRTKTKQFDVYALGLVAPLGGRTGLGALDALHAAIGLRRLHSVLLVYYRHLHGRVFVCMLGGIFQSRPNK